MTQVRCTPEMTVKMQQALRKKRMTAEGLAEITGLSKEAVWRWLRGMRAAKMVRVGKWTEDAIGRKSVAVFAWGSEPDAARPKATPPAVRMAESRARRRAA